MGRSLNKRDRYDILNRDNLSPSGKAFYNGTPKPIMPGMARACYAMLSYNTSTAGAGVAFYDKYFQSVAAIANPELQTTPGNIQNVTAGTMMSPAALFANLSPTQTQTSSSGTSNYFNATNSAGEFGNIGVDAFSNSTVSPATTREYGGSPVQKFQLNRSFVDADLSNKSLGYILRGGALRAVCRLSGGPTYPAPRTENFTVPGLSASMVGSASYNARRKELAILNYTAAGGSFDLIIYKGVDLFKYPSPKTALTQSTVTRVVKPVSLAASWSASNAESNHYLNPVLCDNGDVFVGVMFSSTAFRLYKLARDASDDFTVTLHGSNTLTTSYGAENGEQYGARKMQSRDGSAVLLFSQYYYYGSGITTWLVDKLNSTAATVPSGNDTNTGNGIIPLPYGDSGFGFYYAGNVYTGNHTGAYIKSCVERNGASVLTQVCGITLLPYHTLPNTTNYPGFTQVVDYSMLDNQAL